MSGFKLGLGDRCPKHGHPFPCMECVIDEGWSEARDNAERARRVTANSDGPHVRDVKPMPEPMPSTMPGSMRHRAAQEIESTLLRMQQIQQAAAAPPTTVYPWLRDDLGRWQVDLGDGMELAVYGDLAILFHNTVGVCDCKVEGSDVEKKAAAIALASTFGMRFLSRLPLVVG